MNSPNFFSGLSVILRTSSDTPGYTSAVALPTSTRLTPPTYHSPHNEPSGSVQLVQHLSIAAPSSSSSPPVPYPHASVCRGAPLATIGELISTVVPRVARVAVDVLRPEPAVQVVMRSCPEGTHALTELQVLAGAPHAHCHVARIERVEADEHRPTRSKWPW